jgi:hypothetical protein
MVAASDWENILGFTKMYDLSFRKVTLYRVANALLPDKDLNKKVCHEELKQSPTLSLTRPPITSSGERHSIDDNLRLDRSKQSIQAAVSRSCRTRKPPGHGNVKSTLG